MRNDLRLKAIRNKYGSAIGYAVIGMLFEVLTERDKNKIEYSDTSLFLLSEDFGIEIEAVKNVVQMAVNVGLLTSHDGYLFSKDLANDLAPTYEKREKSKKVQDSDAACDRMEQDVPKSRVEYSKEELYSFDRFWNLYDKKVKKNDAIRAYKKIGTEDLEKIFKTLPDFLKQAGKNGKQFIPYPASYLNARRWEDEITPTLKSSVPVSQLDPETNVW